MTNEPAQEPPVSPATSEGGPVTKERPGATNTPPSDPRVPKVDDPTSEAQERGSGAPSVNP
jgi:hypothetical protein